MTYIVEIIMVIILCSGCFMVYAECCECGDCCTSTDINDELEIGASPVTSPIQNDHSDHIEI